MASFPLLLCVLVCSYCLTALGGNEHDGFVVVPTSTASTSSSGPACSPAPQVASDPNRASMPLAHRHGPCAPATDNRPSPSEMLRRDRARRNHILGKASGWRRITLSDVGVRIPTSLGAAVDSLQYVVTLGIGTPAVQQTVLMDTGSDLSWVQCKPCNSSTCYPQKDPVFDPSASSTYAPVPCESKACRDLVPDGYGDGCTNSSGASLCQYGIQYGNLDTTVGVYSTETLTLTPQASVKSFGFGCGLDQRGRFDLFDGLLGLGGAPESLVSQTAGTYGGAFSYCLPPGKSTTGFLALGAPSNSNGTAGFLFTPLHRVPDQATFYLVTLAGISVGGKQLDIQPAVFSGGMIIDSGSIVTGLPDTAYSALRTAFRSAMSAYPLLPPNSHDVHALDTCYNFTGHTNVTVPTVALTFDGGVTIDLDVPSGILLDGCLAFASGAADGGFGIIGNVNQRTFEVLYDSGRGHVGFRPGAC